MDNYRKIGMVPPVSAREAGDTVWGLGFEKLDRAVFDPEKAYDKVAELGVRHIRIQSGWARTEKVEGVYEFGWLDDIVDNLVRRGLEPWICLCYGNGLYDEAAREVFGAVEIRSSRAASVVRFVLAAGYAATGVLLVVNNFVSVFPAVNAALTTAGAIILFTCLEELFLLKKSGFFAEETLVYCPVRKKGKEETDKGEK